MQLRKTTVTMIKLST